MKEHVDIRDSLSTKITTVAFMTAVKRDLCSTIKKRYCNYLYSMLTMVQIEKIESQHLLVFLFNLPLAVVFCAARADAIRACGRKSRRFGLNDLPFIITKQMPFGLVKNSRREKRFKQEKK